MAEREVVLTYALHALGEAKTLDLLAFKGGTCLRKIVFGSTGSFPEDLDRGGAWRRLARVRTLTPLGGGNRKTSTPGSSGRSN